MPLGGRVDPGEVPTLQQLGLQPLPPGCGSSGGGGDTTQPVGQRQAAASFPAMASGGGAAEAAGGSSSPRGGEGEALRQLRGFLAQAAASGSGGAAYGSNFAGSIAPWLATGCLSPRRMLEDAQAALQAAAGGAGASGAPAAAMQLEQQQQRRPQQDPLSWVRFELMWRDFFRFLTAKYSNTAPAATARSSSGALAGASA
jgi:deoxyribodipyrimidine photolyase